MITREADYAIRSVLYLAGHNEEEEAISAAELAEEIGIPYSFLRKILGTLTKEGITVSSRGKSGGVRLAQEPEDVSLLDVIQAVDERCTKINSCMLGYETCERRGSCGIHDVLETIQDRLENDLNTVTFAQLLSDQAI